MTATPDPRDRATDQVHLDALRATRVGTTPEGPATTRELADVHAGRVGEPLFDEEMAAIARDDLSESADLDGDVPDDAVGEAREMWWESAEDAEPAAGQDDDEA